MVNVFWYSYGSSDCEANGGDQFTCLGPLMIVQQGITYPKDNRDITAIDLLDAQGIAIISGIGQRCEAPLVTWMDIQMPYLTLSSSNCNDTLNIEFNGNYLPYYLDGLDSTLLNETRIYGRTGTYTYQRITISRAYENEDDYGLNVVLATANGDGLNFFKNTWISDIIVTEDWLNSLPLNITFNNNGCHGTLSITGQFDAFVLNPPQVIDDITYSLNKIMLPRFYYSMECNYHTGRTDRETLEPVYPFTVEGELGGGYPLWQSPGLLGVPIQINPDPNFAAYETDCSKFYPPGIPFLTYSTVILMIGGIAISPIDTLNKLCFAPFLDMQGIANSINVEDAKDKDCQQQGGFVFGKTTDYCARSMQITR